MSTKRPVPPEDLRVVGLIPAFHADREFESWMRAVFIDEGGPLHNPEHKHLEYASIGVLWTNITNNRHGNIVLAECALGKPNAMGTWARARMEFQLYEWFGSTPDFVITFNAPACNVLSDRQFVALVDHELMHASQKHDEFGVPKFDKYGRPAFGLRGHDAEQFEEIVRRHGAKSSFAFGLVKAAESQAIFSDKAIAAACGRTQSRRKKAEVS